MLNLYMRFKQRFFPGNMAGNHLRTEFLLWKAWLQKCKEEISYWIWTNNLSTIVAWFNYTDGHLGVRSSMTPVNDQPAMSISNWCADVNYVRVDFSWHLFLNCHNRIIPNDMLALMIRFVSEIYCDSTVNGRFDIDLRFHEHFQITSLTKYLKLFKTQLILNGWNINASDFKHIQFMVIQIRICFNVNIFIVVAEIIQVKKYSQAAFSRNESIIWPPFISISVTQWADASCTNTTGHFRVQLAQALRKATSQPAAQRMPSSSTFFASPHTTCIPYIT